MSRALAFAAVLVAWSADALAKPNLNAQPGLQSSPLRSSPPPARLQGFFVVEPGTGDKAPPVAADASLIKATLVPLQRHDLERRLTLPITIAAREHSELAPPLSGLVEKVLVEPGRTVKEGQVLALLLVRDGAGREQSVKLTAPFAGEVSAAAAHVGTYVQEAGPSLFTLVALDQVQLAFAVPEREVSTVRAGTPLQLHVDVYPSRVYEARVQRVQPQIDPATRTFVAYALLDNPDHGLWPDMRGHVAFSAQHCPHVLALPQAAVAQLQDGSAVVFRLGSDGRARRTPVTLGVADGDFVEIAAGLTEGDKVLLADAPLRDGAGIVVTR